MPLPPEIDNLIRKRFESLLQESAQLRLTSDQSTRQSQPSRIPAGLMRDKIVLSGSAFDSLKTKLLSLLRLIAGGSRSVGILIDDVRQLTNTPSGVDNLIGKIEGLKDDYEAGMLVNLVDVIEANIASDYMGQAEQLLGEGIPGQYDHVPAAVLAGAVFEDALRKLCQRQTPPIALTNPNGSPKTLDPLITDLQMVNVYNKAKADMLKSWAKTRNYAAHGEFTQFNRQDVEAMIAGIKNFLADYL